MRGCHPPFKRGQFFAAEVLPVFNQSGKVGTDVRVFRYETGRMLRILVAQSPDDCYDGTACAELRRRGATSGLPAELAGRLATRWPS